MLYIDIIDDNTVRFGSEAAGAGENRYLPISMEARKDEIELIWIWHIEDDEEKEAYLNAYSVGDITLDGTVYGTAEEFVVALNAAVNIPAITTTTTTIPITTTTTVPATTTTTTVPATTTTTIPVTTTTTTTIPGEDGMNNAQWGEPFVRFDGGLDVDTMDYAQWGEPFVF